MSIQLARANFALGKPTTTPWLETITPRQIAMLLTWTGDTTKNKEQKRDYYLWIDVIEAACQRGELASTAVIERRPALFDLAYDPYRDDAPEYREVTSYHNIKPQDVARWLEGQDQPPGELLEAWFTSQGVGVAAVEMVAPPAPAAQPEAVLMTSQAPHKRQRSDLLTPLIEKAVKACDGSTDKHEVFNVLRQWATEKPPRPPLMGVTDRGIQWLSTNDEAKELTLDALAKRLKPPAKRG